MPDLVARFDAVVPDIWEPHSRPTRESIATIEKHFGCRLPPLLLELAVQSKSFSSYFLSLGPDYQEHNHLIARNAMVRSNPDWLGLGPRAPDHLVFFTNNFMEDFFWCLDLSKPEAMHPIVHWTPLPRELVTPSYSTFGHFLAATVEFFERRSSQREA